MRPWRLNTIATRLAITIILAIILGISLEIVIGFSTAYFASSSGARVIASHSAVHVFNFRREPIFTFSVGYDQKMLVSKIATIAAMIESAPEVARPQIIAAATRADLQLALRSSPLPGVPDGDTEEFDLLRRLIAFQLGDSSHQVIVVLDRLDVPPPSSSDIVRRNTVPEHNALLVEISLPDGRWLVMTVSDYAPRIVSISHAVMVVSPLLILIGLLSMMAARQLAAPIRKFAAAAERLGVDTSALPLPERGPHELRVATRAFNQMQERLRRFVDDRTQMLAAMSHDLRTPLNRLRLRVEFIEDDEQQRKMFADLEAMNAMIDSVLAFARDDARREARRFVDIGILVEDISEDAADAGSSVSYSGPRGVNVCCRPTAIGRAVGNLVDNAVKYAQTAQIRLIQETERVTIVVEDDGPGIPANELEKVFIPFYRLEPSRNADTGGVGLGLSISRTIAREHGGDVTLANRNSGGLCARMTLPT